ncbi:unnamed protein product [Caenorhabditis nigoni]
MILSKYPYVVQKEILDNMDCGQLLMLSFVSKNMKKLIKSSQKNKFENIRVIEYSCGHTSDPRAVHITFEGEYENVMYFSNEEPNRNGTFQLDVSGKLIEFQMCQRHKVPEICGYDRDKESVTESIHNYFLDFFGSSTKFHWRIEDIEEDLNHFVPKLRNVSLYADVGFDENVTELEKLETFFSSYPVFKHIELIPMHMHTLELQPFSPESKFYQAESIFVENTFPNILRHFQGRRAYIECKEWETLEDLIELLNKWKLGEALQKLEHLIFEFVHGQFGHLENQIFNKIGAKYIDATKQPPAHTLPVSFLQVYFSGPLNTEPITSHTYVVRQSDNRVASIFIKEGKSHRRKITFGVWNKTEEEFLKLMG